MQQLRGRLLVRAGCAGTAKAHLLLAQARGPAEPKAEGKLNGGGVPA